MKDILKPFLEKLIELIDEGDNWTVAFIILGLIFVFAGIGSIITWFFNKSKIQADIKKSRVETQKNEIEIIKSIQETRKVYVDNIQLMQISIKESIEAFKNNDINSLSTAWEEARDFYFNELINSFESYQEQIDILLKSNRKKRKYFVNDEILSLLKISLEVLNTLNNEIILNATGKEKIILQEYTLQPTFRYALKSTSFFRFKRRMRIKRIKKELAKHE